MKRPRIAFVTSADPADRSAWSGTVYYMARALQRHCGEVVYVGPGLSLREQLGRVKNRVTRRLTGRNRVYFHTLPIARSHGRSLRRRIGAEFDLVFAPAGASHLAFLDVGVPVVYTGDTTFRLMRDYYPEFSGLSEGYVVQAEEIERRALERADLVLPASQWAADSVRRHYGTAPEKVHVLPYGANLEEVPPAERVGVAAKPAEACVLLFLGVDWERKGGPIAHGAVAALRERGVDARMVVCGTVPPPEYAAGWMRVVPRLSKEDPRERAELSRLLLEASFLLLPTRRECYGIVFCEAAGHGTPSIATDTGGVSGAVLEGRSGFLLPPEASAAEYAELIHRLHRDREGYARLVSSTRRAYDEALNWDAWGSRAGRLVSGLL